MLWFWTHQSSNGNWDVGRKQRQLTDHQTPSQGRKRKCCCRKDNDRVDAKRRPKSSARGELIASAEREITIHITKTELRCLNKKITTFHLYILLYNNNIIPRHRHSQWELCTLPHQCQCHCQHYSEIMRSFQSHHGFFHQDVSTPQYTQCKPESVELHQDFFYLSNSSFGGTLQESGYFGCTVIGL